MPTDDVRFVILRLVQTNSGLLFLSGALNGRERDLRTEKAMAGLQTLT